MASCLPPQGSAGAWRALFQRAFMGICSPALSEDGVPNLVLAAEGRALCPFCGTGKGQSSSPGLQQGCFLPGYFQTRLWSAEGAGSVL